MAQTGDKSFKGEQTNTFIQDCVTLLDLSHHCTCHSVNQRLVRQKADGRACCVGHFCRWFRSHTTRTDSKPAKYPKENSQLVIRPAFCAA